jgi:hypothetical protein
MALYITFTTTNDQLDIHSTSKEWTHIVEENKKHSSGDKHLQIDKQDKHFHVDKHTSKQSIHQTYE